MRRITVNVLDFYKFDWQHQSTKRLQLVHHPKAKDGEKNFASCPLDVQPKLRQCRTKEWQKWKEFNAGVLLTKIEFQ